MKCWKCNSTMIFTNTDPNNGLIGHWKCVECKKRSGFTIICNKCGSENVTTTGTDGFGVYIYCNDCDNNND